MDSITLSKFVQFNFIGDIDEPKYSTNTVIVAVHKIKRSTKDIKLRFREVNPTSDYAGDWFLPRKKALKFKDFINNGLRCKEIPWSEFKKLIIINEEIRA